MKRQVPQQTDRGDTLVPGDVAPRIGREVGAELKGQLPGWLNTRTGTQMTPIDSIDGKLISLLAENPRRSSEELAKELCIGYSTLRRRLNNLVQQRIIYVTGLPRPSQIGFPIQGCILVDAPCKELALIQSGLKATPEITWLASTVGRYKTIALCRFPSADRLSCFVNQEIRRAHVLADMEVLGCARIEKSPLPY